MRIGINTALLLAVASSVAAGIVALTLYSTLSTQQISSEIQSEALLGSAKSTKEFLGFYIQQSREVVRDISVLPAVKEALATDPDRVKALLRSFVTQSDMFSTLMLLDPSGKPVAGEARSGDPLAPSYADREYFQAIAGGQDSYVTRRILRGKTSNVLMFVVSQAVRGPDGKLLGVVVGCPAWEPFTKRFVDPLKFGASGYAFLIDGEGIVIAHGADKSLILKKDMDLSLSRKILEIKNGILRYTFNNQEKYLAVATLPETGWVVCMNASAAEMNAGAMRQRTILIAVGLAVLVVVVAVISIFNRIVVLSPLAAIGEFTRKVAAGDLKAALAGRFRFELAPLADNLRHMVDELKAKLGFAEGVLHGIPAPCAILTPDRKLSWLNRQACASLEKTQAPETYRGQSAGAFFFGDPDRSTLSDKALLEKHPITAKVDYRVPSGAEHHYDFAATPFFDMDGNLLGSFTFWTDLTEIVTQQKRIEEQNTIIAHTAAEAAAVSDRMASAAQQLSAQIEQSTNGVDLQHQRIQDTATAIEEMNATILEVAKNAGNTAQSAENAKGKASEGEHLVAEVVRSVLAVRNEAEGLKVTMHGLGEQAQGIGAVLGVISDIADQTNLLALNAAIEAARAGDAGRGFAVVADEVRKLAEKTMTATSEVGQAIRGIQQGTKDTVSRVEGAVDSVAQAAGLAERSGGTLKEIVTLVVAAGDQVRSIATAAEQQSATSEEINRSVEEVNRLSTETADAMAQSNQAVAELSELAQRLNALIRQLEGGGASPRALASA